MDEPVSLPTSKSLHDSTVSWNMETPLKDIGLNSSEGNQSLLPCQAPTPPLPQKPSTQMTPMPVLSTVRGQVPHEIVINYDMSSQTYNIVNIKNNQKWKSCLLDCKNKLPFDLILEVRNMFGSLSNASEKKDYIKKCLVFKCNDKIKRRKKYKRDMSYNCLYYIIVNERTLRVCQRCFRFILGLTRYNLSNIIKESLPSTH